MGIIEKGIRTIYGTTCFVYELTSNKRSVFMRIDKTPYENENRYIILIDLKKIYKYYDDQDNGKFTRAASISEEEYFRREYNYTEDEFKRSMEIPVSLPEVSAYIDEFKIKKLFKKPQIIKKLKIGFIDGITRTQWLFNNGFDIYPVETDDESAHLLHEHFGIKGTKIYTVEKLLELSENEPN